MEFFDAKSVARELTENGGFKLAGVENAIQLLEEGNTLPFIARYRKEAILGLDESDLRVIEDGLARAKELAARKKTVLTTIEGLGQLTPELKKQILECDEKNRLEDIYLPFKPKRRNKATIAREQGLEPLAKILLTQERLGRTKKSLLNEYVNSELGVNSPEDAYAGAAHIVAEAWSEDIEVRQWFLKEAESGMVTSKVKRGKKEEGKKFDKYFAFSEPIRRVPSHRFLAIKRGESEKILNVGIELNEDYFVRQLKRRLVINRDFEFFHDLLELAESTYKTHFLPAATSALLGQLKEKADVEAIEVFVKNLRELLLSPPAGKKVTMGLDPGFRTGCKVAVVDATGKFLETKTIYPTAPKNDIEGASKVVLELVKKHRVELIAIGNGTASRETDAFASELIKKNKLDITKVVVSESGASIYSASQLAIEEYPDLDITVRGAISIAHRLQDPLSELVKLDPKSIGVGQYQHDVNQTLLKKSLDREVESCVNSVGVELNMASGRLLSYVAGVGDKLAERIVEFRDKNGAFQSRKGLKDVPKLGKRAFEQAAGFLRVNEGGEPLDNSAVHPECYYIVKKMAKSLSVKTSDLIGNESLANKLKPADFVDDKFGLPTIQDILSELAKPGRDPRKEFKTVTFDESVNEVSDLREGLILQGQVTNVTKFGAFVDIGVHQDGLVHVSEMADRYISDPSEVVSVGDIVRVKVMQVEVDRKRIGLSMKQA